MSQFGDNKELQQEWAEAKIARKKILAAYILAKTGYTINPKALFDIQVGLDRFHIDNVSGRIYNLEILT